MAWLIGIAGVWILCCIMVVALCAAARRGDERLTLLAATVPEAPADADFVLTFAAPASAPAVPASAPASRASL